MIQPYYTADAVTLYLGDCIEVMRALPDASVDACVTDPPYELGFMGSGTTLRAAKDLGRRAIGIEISERYCEIAVERLRQGVLL